MTMTSRPKSQLAAAFAVVALTAGVGGYFLAMPRGTLSDGGRKPV